MKHMILVPFLALSVLFAASRYGYLYQSEDGGSSLRKLSREFSEVSSVHWVPA